MRNPAISAIFFILFSVFGMSIPVMAGAEVVRVEQPFVQEISGVDPMPLRDYIRIAAWDIEWFPAGLRGGALQNAQWQTAAATALIREVNPDILLTQETRDLESIKQLNRNLGSRGYSHLASSAYGVENLSAKLKDAPHQQCGILSHHPWNTIWELDFAALKNFSQPVRGWLGVQFKIRGLEFTLYNSFLPADSAVRREAAIDELKRDFDRQGLDPYRDKIMVLGNFNTDYFDGGSQDEKTFGKLSGLGFQHTWGTQTRNTIVTHPAPEGGAVTDSTPDSIWISSGWGDSLPEARVLAKGASRKKGVHGGDEPGLASDHYPLWIDIPVKK